MTGIFIEKSALIFMLGEVQGFACDLELYLRQNYVCMIIWRVKQLENQKTSLSNVEHERNPVHSW
jgi:hypothetical protein